MDALEPKKLALIRILQIFQKHSDYDHPLTQEDVAAFLEQDYGIIIERKDFTTKGGRLCDRIRSERQLFR